jgi:integrase
MGKLIAIGVKNQNVPGRYGDGDGLWLQVQGPTQKSWLLRYSFGGKAREMGLGPVAHVGLAEAREQARAQRALLRQGIDPLAAKRGTSTAAANEPPGLTFRKAAEDLIASKRPGLRNDKHASQWSSTLATYVYPSIGDKPASAVTTDDVLAILRPIWVSKHETAARLRGRIQAVLSAAKVREGWQGHSNPALWKDNLEHLLPAPRKVHVVEHHVALPWQDAPAFIARLRQAKGVGARALEFTILTAVRTNMTIGATWAQVDEREQVWAVPSERMKSGKQMRIPLSEAAMVVLAALRPLRRPDRGDFIFPDVRHGQPISNMTMAKVLWV